MTSSRLGARQGSGRTAVDPMTEGRQKHQHQRLSRATSGSSMHSAKTHLLLVSFGKDMRKWLLVEYCF